MDIFQVKYSGVRALGNLLRYVPADTLSKHVTNATRNSDPFENYHKRN